MRQAAAATLRRPPLDNRPLMDFAYGSLGFNALLVAHDLKLFPLLAEQPRTLPEVCEALHIAPRPAEGLVALCVSLGLVSVQDGRYGLTPLAEEYLLDSSPVYFGGYLDYFIANPYTFESVKKAVLTDAPQWHGGDWVKTHEEQAQLARAFTHTMHSMSMGPALAWPEVMDLSGHRLLLDIGGGSGAHCIGAALRWPTLHATVFDIAPVCEVAQEFAAHYGLQVRIRTQVGDLWTDPFPAADLHFYSMIYHDWPVEKCRFLAQKSFASLEPGGRIIIHEMLYHDDKTGPLPVAAYSLFMLWAAGGQQFSGRELSKMLMEAGFTDVEVKPTFGYWSIVTGRKP